MSVSHATINPHKMVNVVETALIAIRKKKSMLKKMSVPIKSSKSVAHAIKKKSILHFKNVPQSQINKM